MDKMPEPFYSRLTHMADFLEKVPDGNFDIDLVISLDRRLHGTLCSLRDVFFGIAESKPIHHDCGSTACIAGWCPVAFPENFEYNEPNRRAVEIGSVNHFRPHGTSALIMCPRFFEIHSAYFYPNIGYTEKKSVIKVFRLLANGEINFNAPLDTRLLIKLNVEEAQKYKYRFEGETE